VRSLCPAFVDDRILRALLPLNGSHYHTIQLRALPADLVPSLLHSTNLYSLLLTQPKDLTDEMIKKIDTEIPSLNFFEVRGADGKIRWSRVHNNASLPF
jgi:hypothetical protein